MSYTMKHILYIFAITLYWLILWQEKVCLKNMQRWVLRGGGLRIKKQKQDQPHQEKNPKQEVKKWRKEAIKNITEKPELSGVE